MHGGVLLSAGSGFGFVHHAAQHAFSRSAGPVATQLIYIETTGDKVSVKAPEGAAFSGPLDSPAVRIGATRLPSLPRLKAGSMAARESEVPSNAAPPVRREFVVSSQPYCDQIRAKLSRAIHFDRGQPTGDVMLRFVVDSQGRVQNYRFLSIHGISPDLREEVMRGLQTAAPFPPLPASWARSEVSFTVRLIFQDGKRVG